MKKHVNRSIVCCLGLLLTLALTTPAFAGELELDLGELQGIINEPSSPVAVDSAAVAQSAAAFRQWAAASIDLAVAEQWASTRMHRVTYRQDLVHDRPLQLTTESRVAADTAPTTVWLREGPLYHSQLKAREADGPQTPWPEQELVAAVWQYLVDSNLVAETEVAALSTAQVMGRRRNRDRGEGLEPADELVQQDVVLQRVVAGRPVVNAQVIVGVLPDTAEIVKLLIKSWAPLATGTPIEGPITPALDTEQLTAQLRSNLDRAVGSDWTRARVIRQIPAWFQTRDRLLPVIACVVDLEMPDPTQNLTIVELLNPYGSTELLRDAVEAG